MSLLCVYGSAQSFEYQITHTQKTVVQLSVSQYNRTIFDIVATLLRHKVPFCSGVNHYFSLDSIRAKAGLGYFTDNSDRLKELYNGGLVQCCSHQRWWGNKGAAAASRSIACTAKGSAFKDTHLCNRSFKIVFVWNHTTTKKPGPGGNEQRSEVFDTAVLLHV